MYWGINVWLCCEPGLKNVYNQLIIVILINYNISHTKKANIIHSRNSHGVSAQELPMSSAIKEVFAQHSVQSSIHKSPNTIINPHVSAHMYL